MKWLLLVMCAGLFIAGCTGAVEVMPDYVPAVQDVVAEPELPIEAETEIEADEERLMAPGQLGLHYIHYISTNFPARSAFTYVEKATAHWIAAELERLGHPADHIRIQAFSYDDFNYQAEAHGLGLNPVRWAHVTSPFILGHGREYQLRQDRVSQNVILTVPGQSPYTIKVIAHYDSPPYASASDNASGVAMLLESTAGILDMDHYYTIQYVFLGAEEVGLIGAFWYYHMMTPAEHDHLRLVINGDVLIEGPYLVYGAGSLPPLEREDLYQKLRNDINRDFLQTAPVEMIMLHAINSAHIQPQTDEITDFISQLADDHPAHFYSVPKAAAFPSDQQAFLFGGHRVLTLAGFEKYENLQNIPDEFLLQMGRRGRFLGDFALTVLHSPLDDFYVIEEIWPGMMAANMEAFATLLTSILTSRLY